MIYDFSKVRFSTVVGIDIAREHVPSWPQWVPSTPDRETMPLSVRKRERRVRTAPKMSALQWRSARRTGTGREPSSSCGSSSASAATEHRQEDDAGGDGDGGSDGDPDSSDPDPEVPLLTRQLLRLIAAAFGTGTIIEMAFREALLRGVATR
jgi:hypothetical protein